MTATADAARRAPRRVAVVGVSSTVTCGVRDHARLLADALAAENVACSMHWLDRTRSALRPAHEEVRAWARALGEELEGEAPDAVLLHYSVFAQSYRGVPVFVAPVVRALSGTGLPVIAFLHEYAYPWGRSGARGALWASSQRIALIGVLRASAAAVVTVEDRIPWLRSRPWLPRRPLAFAPVFSTLPEPSATAPGPLARAQGEEPVIGLFGYSSKRSVMEVVLDALAILRATGPSVKLALLGGPGPDSPIAGDWRAGASARSLDGALLFSGVLPPERLVDALAACELLLFADGPGPTSRKTTLAGSLASGRAVVALDGHSTWDEVVEAGALELAAAAPDAIAAAVRRLIADPTLREAIGSRGRMFADREMGVTRSAAVVAGLVRDVTSQPS